MVNKIKQIDTIKEEKRAIALNKINNECYICGNECYKNDKGNKVCYTCYSEFKGCEDDF